ncbi:MAG: DUF2339 domain-containing protein [Flavobacterium sp.]
MYCISCCVHFVFLAVLITVIQNYKNQLVNTITAVISIFSIFLYIVSFYKLTNFEIVENLIYTTQNQYAFYLHYVTVIALLYVVYQLYKRATAENKLQLLSGKIMPWLAVFSIVYVLSCELLIHGLHFSSPIDAAKITQYNPNISSFNDASIYEISSFANYELSKTKTQIIKIGYPILWGLFSFVFLIIGIKKQSKTLRIIALSLLGLTIAKLFVYDINNASETGRIIAFILLGVLILIISFVYQKLKKLVTSDEPKKTNDEG